MPYKMPVFYGGHSEDEDTSSATKIEYWKPLLCLTFFYYVITCGIERIFQLMVSLLITLFYVLV